MLASVGWDGAGQGQVDLSYYLGDAPAQLDQSTFETVVEDALKVWSDVADIHFTETSRPGQNDSLDITFAALDGSGGVLAQAYFPNDLNRSTIAGDVQFDSSETWEVGNENGSQAFDLLYVAVHEIGHALGLDHSSIAGSVLNGSVSSNHQFSELADSDRNSILALYAPAQPTLNPTDSMNTPLEPGLPDNPVAEIPERDTGDPVENSTDEQLPTEEASGDDGNSDQDPAEREPTDRWKRRWNRILRFLGRNPDWFGDSTDDVVSFIPTNQSGRVSFRWFTPF